MPIPVTCVCGRRFAASDSLAGTRAACPACGQAIAIPASGRQYPQTTYPQMTYPQYGEAPSSGHKPWGRILGIGGGVLVLLAVIGFVGLATFRMVLKHMPREPARSSKLPAEFMEQQWKELNPGGEVKWETYSPTGSYTLEWPSTKAVSFPRNGFDAITLFNARALGPEGPYFAVMSSSAVLVSQYHGKPGESSQEILETAIRVRQTLPKGKLVSSSDFQMEGLPGKEMTFAETIDGKPIVIHVRMIVAGIHLYVVWVGGLESSLKNEDVRRFLDSFQLTKKGAAGQF